jgi:RNA polymerase sigma-70 factor, ECF subfamily
VQPDETDAILVSRAIQRDHEAFGALYERHFERIYRYVRLKVGDPQEAEDVTSVVFLNAWRGMERFNPRGQGSFAAWLFRLAHNALVDRFRRRRDMAPLETVAEHQLPVDVSFHPEAVLERRMTIDELHGALQALTDEQRDVILLRFVEGLSGREIADIMGKQEGAVRGMQLRALEALRRALALPKVRRSHG